MMRFAFMGFTTVHRLRRKPELSTEFEAVHLSNYRNGIAWFAHSLVINVLMADARTVRPYVWRQFGWLDF